MDLIVIQLARRQRFAHLRNHRVVSKFILLRKFFGFVQEFKNLEQVSSVVKRVKISLDKLPDEISGD